MKNLSTQQLISSVIIRIRNNCKHGCCEKGFENKRKQKIIKTLNGLGQDLSRLKGYITNQARNKSQQQYQYQNDPFERNWGRINPQRFGIESNSDIHLNRTHYGVINQADGTRMKQIIYNSQNPQTEMAKNPMKFDYDRLYAKSEARYKYNPKNANKYRSQSKSKIGKIIQKDKFNKAYNKSNNFMTL